MEKKLIEKKDVVLYVVCTYIAFWLSILAIGGIMLLCNKPQLQKVAVIVGAWTPTIVFLLLFPKLCHGITRREYCKNFF